MNILHITKRYPRAIGGDAVVVSHIARYQQKDGHRVFVLTSNCPDITKQKDVTKFGLPLSNIAIDIISLNRIITLCGLIVYSFWYLRKIKPDVIHSHTMDLGFAVSFAARLYRIPMINTCHSISFTAAHFSAAKQKLEVWLLRSARYKMLTTVDASSVGEFARVGLGPVVYKSNGVEVDEFDHCRPHTSGETFRILYVGRLVEEKGVGYLLDAVAAARKKLGDFELTIAGEGSLMEDFKAQVATLGLSDRVTFLGRKSPKELRALYANADLFIMPSLYEAFGLVVLEAWASSLPVIATNIGSMAQLCKNRSNSLVVEPGDSKALAKAIITLHDDPKLAAKIGAAGRALVESNYTYRTVADSMYEVYKKVMS